MPWIGLVIALALVVGVAVWYLVFKTEGVYLGRRAVIWLYDVYAGRYDGIKQYAPDDERDFLAHPILDHIAPLRAPLVLDVATGTGRLPLALLEVPIFQGRVIALDLSRRMLGVAAGKLAPHRDRVVLLHLPAENLPFPNGTFDLVTCLEALEFMMDPAAVLHELVRVLRPGGALVLTNRQGPDARLMPGHTWPHDALERLLRDDLGLERVAIQPWQMDYRLVFARRPGPPTPTGPLPLEAVWRCPRCAAQELIAVDGGWRCLVCEQALQRAPDGVLEVPGVSP